MSANAHNHITVHAPKMEPIVLHLLSPVTFTLVISPGTDIETIGRAPEALKQAAGEFGIRLSLFFLFVTWRGSTIRIL